MRELWNYHDDASSTTTPSSSVLFGAVRKPAVPGRRMLASSWTDGTLDNLEDTRMERPPDLASAVEMAAEALVGVLEAARAQHPSPVSPTQLRVLALINGRPVTNVNALADLMQVVPSSASRLCDRLEAIGLLARVADQRDRREVHLRLTGAAQTLLRELRERRRDAVAQVLDRMPVRAQRDLLTALLAFDEAASASAAPLSASAAPADVPGQRAHTA